MSKISLLSIHDYQCVSMWLFQPQQHGKESSGESDKIPIQILILLHITYVI